MDVRSIHIIGNAAVLTEVQANPEFWAETAMSPPTFMTDLPRHEDLSEKDAVFFLTTLDDGNLFTQCQTLREAKRGCSINLIPWDNRSLEDRKQVLTEALRHAMRT